MGFCPDVVETVTISNPTLEKVKMSFRDKLEMILSIFNSKLRKCF